MQEERARKLAERTIDFGLAVIDYVDHLPRNAVGRHISDQLLRSATSVGANYAEVLTSLRSEAVKQYSITALQYSVNKDFSLLSAGCCMAVML